MPHDPDFLLGWLRFLSSARRHDPGSCQVQDCALCAQDPADGSQRNLDSVLDAFDALDRHLVNDNEPPGDWRPRRPVTAPQPRVEVALSLDANNGVGGGGLAAVAVFVDGQWNRQAVCKVVQTDDTLSAVTWRERAWKVTRTGSPAFTRLLDHWFHEAEGNLSNQDRDPARNPQPGVRIAADLDPERWYLEGEGHPNTRRAARAVMALQEFLVRADTTDELDALAPVVTAYRSLAEDADEDIPTMAEVLTSLFTNLRHLAEACGVRLEGEQEPGDAMGRDLVTMVAKLRTAALTVWAEGLRAEGSSLDEIEADAFRRFLEQAG
ncbi:hypothetical protein [Lentzea terrae]|uniref:hypothetical protein n=1 Tax=Lentzea terrae TaxID=2200761 RepID=UPI000DD36FB0|nr:hypothetical protein [Lentzea terrae]